MRTNIVGLHIKNKIWISLLLGERRCFEQLDVLILKNRPNTEFMARSAADIPPSFLQTPGV